MKTLIICAFIVLALIVVLNVYTRTGDPMVRPDVLIPWLAGHDLLSWAFGWFLKPGVYALWYLGLDADTRNQLIIAAILSWWAWLMLARILRFTLLLKE